jgi:ABC-2 type transport system permease protein
MGANWRAQGRAVLRLWWLYARMDFLWITRVPSMFFTYFWSDIVLSVAGVTAVVLLAERFDGIGAWTKPQILFMLGYATLIEGVINTFFGWNILLISRRLGRGQFDHTLIQPRPLWMTLLTEGFLPCSGSAILVPGIALIAWSVQSLDVSLSFAWFGWFLLNLLASTAIVLAFSYGWGSLAFWAPRSAEEISASSHSIVSQLKIFPLDGVGAVLAGGLLTILPAGFIAWWPCRFLVGIDPRPSVGLFTPLAALCFGLLAAFMFKKGLIHYGHTGSSRYLNLGHRR